MLGAVNFGHEAMQTVIDAIISLAEVAAKDPRPLPEEPAEADAISKAFKSFGKKTC